MLNKIQAKRCAPVSSCSRGSLGKLLLADLEKNRGFVGKYSSLSQSLPVGLLCSHLALCFYLPISCCPVLTAVVSVAGDADEQQVSLSVMILALLMCFTELCAGWTGMSGHPAHQHRAEMENLS